MQLREKVRLSLKMRYTPLEELNLSVRAYNCLKRSGINTLEELSQLSYEETRKIRNIGPAFNEVVKFLRLEPSEDIPNNTENRLQDNNYKDFFNDIMEDDDALEDFYDGIIEYDDGLIENFFIDIMEDNDALEEDLEQAGISLAGNTASNLIDGGFAAIQGEWIFFVNSEDNNRLYKIHIHGATQVKLDNDIFVSHINVVDDWIYFESHHINNNGAPCICKIRTDGSEKKVVLRDASSPYYYNGWIYFFEDDYSTKSRYLFKTYEAHKKFPVIHSQGGAGSVNILDDWLYFHDGALAGELKKLFLDTEIVYPVRNDNYKEICSNINVVGDWIYYIFKQNYPRKRYHGYINTEDKIYRIRTNGTNREKISDTEILTMHICHNTIFFSNINDNCKLYKMNLDGTEEIKLCDDRAMAINVVGDWVYFQGDTSNGKKFFRIRTDGTERQIVGNYICESQDSKNADSSR